MSQHSNTSPNSNKSANSKASSKPIQLDEDSQSRAKYSRNLFQTLSQAYRPYLLGIGTSVVLGFVGRILLLGNANLIGYWVDSLCRAPAHCKPAPEFLRNFTNENYIETLLVMVVLGFICTVIFRILFSRQSALAVSAIHDEVVLRTSRFPMSFFDRTPTGRIVTRFSSDYGNIFRLFGGPLAEFLSIVFELIVMVGLITLANPYFLIFVLLVVVLNYITYRLNIEKLRESRRILSGSRSPSIAHFAETTQGASVIRSFRQQDTFENRFEKLDQFFLEQKRKTTKRLVFYSFQMNSLSAIFLITTGLASLWMIKHGITSVGSVGVAFSFIVYSGNTIQMFFEWLAQLEEAMIGVERLDRYLRLPIEPGNPLPSSSKFQTDQAKYSPSLEKYLKHRRLTDDKAASVEFNDVWFKYAEDLPWVLKGLNVSIPAQEKWGIIGKTGSGKSSLIQALFYLYPLSKGYISINGHKPKLDEKDNGMDLNLYRKSISFIAQDPTLFQGTLRENLDVEAALPDESLLHALNRVGLATWVKSPEVGLNFRIEERGKNLSLGERQLLCMARCLLQDSPVIVLDEATSSVDPMSEEIMVKATEEFFHDRTQLIIAHRLSTLEKCDQVMWIENGVIKKIGPPSLVLPEYSKINELNP